MATTPKEKLVRVVHKGTEGTFTHGSYVLPPGGELEVPESVAEIWTSHKHYGKPRVVIAGSAEDKAARNANEALKAENQTLADKVKALEAELAKLAGQKLDKGK